MRTKLMVVVSIVAALVVAIGSALADDESDRRNVISQIESKLDSAASELSGMDRNSDSRDIDDAQNYIRDVERLVADLKRVKGSDSTAERIVSYYPDYIREFRRAADELKKLKERQPKSGELIRQCKTFDSEMVSRANATKDDPRGAEYLSEYVRSTGRKGEELMSDASRQWSEVERSRDDVKRFSASDGRWSYVRRSLHDSADNIARAWRDDWDKAKRECEEVVKGPRHKEVERVLDRLASSRTGRAELRKKLEELLVNLQDRVKDVHSHSDTSQVRAALALTRELESQLERLRNASGDDPESRRVASSWPSWVGSLRTSLEALEQLKFNQGRADGGAGKCEAAERTLRDTVRRYVGDPTLHAQGIQYLPVEAERVGLPIRAGIVNAAEVDRKMESWLDKAKSFGQSEGQWSRVTSNLRDSSDRVFRHWRDHFEGMKKACERLVQGKDQPDVKRAVDEMMRDTSAAGDNYRKLREEFNRWKAEVDKLRELSAKDLEEIRRELCSATDHDELGSVKEIADRWASQIGSLYGSITGSADRIKRSADELIAKKRALKAAPKTKQAVDTVLDSIARIKDHQLKGSNNPKLLARIQYGNSRHSSLQQGCDAREVLVESRYCNNPNPKRGDCKIDCLIGCEVIEIKPDNQPAMSLGRAQASAYAQGLQEMYKAMGYQMFEGKLAGLQSCVSQDKGSLNIKWRVQEYPFCPKSEELGPRLEKVTTSLPEQAE